LGRIIEVLSGQSYESFLKERIFDPLGMTDTTFYPTPEQLQRCALTYAKKNGELKADPGLLIGPPAKARYPIPAGGLYSTAGDLARLYQMMLCRGSAGGKPILSEASIRTMAQVQTGDLKAGFTEGTGFGYGWGVVRTPQGVTEMLSPGSYGHGGAFGTQAWIDPHKDLFVVLLIQRVGLPNPDASEMRREFQRIAFSALSH
jgi:CubicO group peptidase (beta-lactamase class C family)